MSGNNKRSKAKSQNKIPVFTKKMQMKIAVLFIIIVLCLLALAFRLLDIYNKKGDDYTVQVLSQQNYTSKIIPYKRGDILDRNGMTLATSVKVYNLILDPKVMFTKDEYIDPTVSALVECFGYDEQELRKVLSENEKKSYVVYKKKLSYNEIEPFVEMMNDTDNNPYIKGVWFETEYERKYPYSNLACHVLGFANAGNVGTWGIEEYYNKILNGVDGRQYGYVNSENVMEEVVKPAENGNTVVSTIDFNIQTIVERYIAECKEDYNPKNIGVIVMNPQNGEIYAMATDTTYDLNNPRDLSAYYTQEEIEAMSDEETLNAMNSIWRNFCLNDTFEPGSTFKPFTVASALEENYIDEGTTFTCDGSEQIGGYTINCHKHEGHGVISVEQAVAYSCNDAMMDISARLGVRMFCAYQERFNFGYKTGVDLPGEASCEGLLYSSDVMKPVDLATNSFGQNFNVTMIQLAAGFSSLINGGYYYQPHVVKEILNEKGGVIEEVGSTPIKQNITKETSDLLKESMIMTTTDGTGKAAKVEGYTIGGKTGTAQKLPREDNKFVYSYIGYAVYEYPELICYVVIDEPEAETASSVTCAKMFKSIMSESLKYLQIFPDEKVEDVAGDDNTSDTGNTGDTGNAGDNGNTGNAGDAGNTGDNTNNGNGTTGDNEGPPPDESEDEEGVVTLPEGL